MNSGVRAEYILQYPGEGSAYTRIMLNNLRQMLTINDSDRLVGSFCLVLPAEDDRQ